MTSKTASKTETDPSTEGVAKNGEEVNVMFKIVDRPVETRRGRKPLFNTFTGNLPGEGKAGSFEVEAESVEARRAIRQIREAAHEEGKSARIMVSDPVKGKVTVTFWTQPRVARKQKASK